ncbi:hypothetical protein D5R38_18580 [Serratia marcescens]|uniref:hypothetical protein n=1 Tax=Serratia marcescens TaxID=615 RepID=UPI00106725FF|nr:hypothetical protein [Serratia marcescens]TEW83377.1 hypothetical protein D5R38_18580 [Serratia marcescens]
MATPYDIFAGSYVSAYYSDKTDNTTIQGTDFKEIPELGGFADTGLERNVITAANYSHKYNRKLVGRASVPDIEMPVNYVPGSVHDQLVKMCEDGKRFQLKIVRWFDSTQTEGVAQVYNGFLSSAGETGSEDAVVQKTFKFAVDGGPVAEGIINTPVKP